MGYTASKTQLMIGLGVSAISDSWYGFAQNVKSIEEYYHLLKEQILPVFRGHILSDEDLIIRRHILNLMCDFKTTWSSNHLYFKELPDVLIKLKEMEHDGILEIEKDSIKILPEGRPFVRNVCMAFDLLLQRKQPNTQLFSMTV
jgi:oxygen-independent coproporphyrinogen-3 oxidase